MMLNDKYDVTPDYNFSENMMEPKNLVKYQNMDVLEKYFCYKFEKDTRSHEVYLKEAYKKNFRDFCDKAENLGIYGCENDPDSYSELLQDIYIKLWEEEHIQYCRNIQYCQNIQGETMNSVQTTMNEAMKIIQKEKWWEIYDEKKRRSVTSAIAMYANRDTTKFDEDLKKIAGLEEFTSHYHTLGNFIPISVGCNGPRGWGSTKDYWDLTLYIIYKWYMEKDKKEESKKLIEGMQPKGKASEDNWSKRIMSYISWLDSFKSWNNFVEINYMQDFVNKNLDGAYGEPKELWEGHLKDWYDCKHALPHKKEQIEQFFSNASSWIEARSVRMIEALKLKALVS